MFILKSKPESSSEYTVLSEHATQYDAQMAVYMPLGIFELFWEEHEDGSITTDFSMTDYRIEQIN